MNSEYLATVRFRQQSRRVRFEIGEMLNYNTPVKGQSEGSWSFEIITLVKENGQMDKFKRILRDKGIIDD
jgi:hypothetical protein